MADNERLAALRQALDDAMLTHTGRSIGDLASERVLADIMGEIETLNSKSFDHLSQQYDKARERWKQLMERKEAEADVMHAKVESGDGIIDAQIERIAELEAENAAMRPIVAAVADIENSDGSACFVTCELVMYDSELDPPDEIRHTSPCIIEQARAFLASAGQAAASEGE